MGSRRRRHAALIAAIASACGSEATKPAAVDSRAEVAAMFAELAVREEAYKIDSGTYLGAPACSDPAACADWKKLNVKSPIPKPACSYTITAGTGGTATPPAGFTMTAPPGSWYFIVATCADATHFVSSTDSSIQRVAK